jgi:ABC-type nitrate/sulfonate/bicarbonate transport system permease component
VDEGLYDVIRTLGGARRDEIFLICFPASLPAIFAGLQISLSMAWMCVLAAELVSARSGLGFLIINGMNGSKPQLILAGMVMIALVAWLTSVAMSYVEKRLCPWKRDIAGF